MQALPFIAWPSGKADFEPLPARAKTIGRPKARSRAICRTAADRWTRCCGRGHTPGSFSVNADVIVPSIHQQVPQAGYSSNDVPSGSAADASTLSPSAVVRHFPSASKFSSAKPERIHSLMTTGAGRIFSMLIHAISGANAAGHPGRHPSVSARLPAEEQAAHRANCRAGTSREAQRTYGSDRT